MNKFKQDMFALLSERDKLWNKSIDDANNADAPINYEKLMMSLSDNRQKIDMSLLEFEERNSPKKKGWGK